LQESLGTVASTKAGYDKILELRIANAQMIVNYAAFLEENQYFEESFKVRLADGLLCHNDLTWPGL
jgi:pre-mRNA-splicing factor SYF1